MGKYCDYAPSVIIRIWFAWPVIPRNVRHSNPFLSSSQCTQNWSGLWVAECPITGDVFCVASSPGIASDRRWPTLSGDITRRSRHTRTASQGSSSAPRFRGRHPDNAFKTGILEYQTLQIIMIRGRERWFPPLFDPLGEKGSVHPPHTPLAMRLIIMRSPVPSPGVSRMEPCVVPSGKEGAIRQTTPELRKPPRITSTSAA